MKYCFSPENTLLTYLTSNSGGKSFPFCPKSKQQVTLLFQRASQLTGPSGHASSHMKIFSCMFWELNQICHLFSAHKLVFLNENSLYINTTGEIINLLWFRKTKIKKGTLKNYFKWNYHITQVISYLHEKLLEFLRKNHFKNFLELLDWWAHSEHM